MNLKKGALTCNLNKRNSLVIYEFKEGLYSFQPCSRDYVFIGLLNHTFIVITVEILSVKVHLYAVYKKIFPVPYP